jgi:dihydrofolate synthase/folylpolyglutamate synthase
LVAFEKAGIFRQGKPALCGDLDPPQPLLDKASELACPLFLRGRDFDLASTDHWHWRGSKADGTQVELRDLPLLDLPMENAALALQAFALMGLPWDEAQVAGAAGHPYHRASGSSLAGFKGKRLSCCWMWATTRMRPSIWRGAWPARRRSASGGVRAAGRQGSGWCVAPLQGLVGHWAVAPLDTPRSRPAEELAALDEPRCAR